jgi:hypothetical protein
MPLEANPHFRAAKAEHARKLNLTPRWTTLKPHPIQALYFWHPARFKINPSGRRSGKTELAKRKAVTRLIKPNKLGGPRRILMAAPTFDQAKSIFWDDLKALIPEHWKAKTNESTLTIYTKWGALIRVMGFDRPQRMEGTPWDDVFIDEIADCKPKCFEMNVRPALSTLGREGSCDLLGVPDEVGPNQIEYEKLWEMGLLWPHNPLDICSFHWSSAEIIDPAEVAVARATMDEFAFRQEYGGQFLRSGGKAVPLFDVSTHVDHKDHYTEYCRWLPLDWSLDFGTNPAASIIGQAYRGQVWIMDEIVIRDSSTEVAGQEFLERVGKRGYASHSFRVFGDAAGRSPHSNVGTTDYEILEKVLKGYRVEWLNLRVAPLVKDTLNGVRAKVCTVDGEIHLHIHPRCKHLIDDLKTAPWPSDLRQFHCLAALRYYLWALFGDPTALYETQPLALADWHPTTTKPVRRPGVTTVRDTYTRGG